jgi:hypothetical protein
MEVENGAQFRLAPSGHGVDIWIYFTKSSSLRIELAYILCNLLHIILAPSSPLCNISNSETNVASNWPLPYDFSCDLCQLRRQPALSNSHYCLGMITMQNQTMYNEVPLLTITLVYLGFSPTPVSKPILVSPPSPSMVHCKFIPPPSITLPIVANLLS